MRGTKSWRFWTVLALVAAAGGTLAWRRLKGREAPAPTAKVERGDIEIKYAEAGEVVPQVKVLVRSPVQGSIARLPIEEGQRVRKGELLAVVQPGRSKAERFLPVEILAPIDGTVLERFLQEGETVSDAGDQSRIAALTDMARMEVLLKVNEVDILKLGPGMPATVSLDALPGETFPGRVRFVSPGVKGQKEGQNWDDAQRGVKTFEVRIALAKADPRFRPGMTVRVELTLDQKRGVLKVPLSAVEEQGGQARVFAPGKPPAPRPVRLGLRGDLEAEVLEGLREGEEVLLQKPEGPPAGSGPARSGLARSR